MVLGDETRPRARQARLALLVAILAAGCGGDEPAPAADSPAQPTVAGGTTSPGTPDLGNPGHALGAADAPVTVIEFSDFGCGYCAQFANEVHPALNDEYIETGQVRWQYVPFVLGIFPNGEQAGIAAECAAEQDRFWPMHDLLFQRQRAWKSESEPRPLFLTMARDAGLDATRFAACLDSPEAADRLRRNTELAEGIGVRSTPSFLVNGRPVQGALPLDQFRMMLQWAGAEGGT